MRIHIGLRSVCVSLITMRMFVSGPLATPISALGAPLGETWALFNGKEAEEAEEQKKNGKNNNNCCLHKQYSRRGL